MEWVAEFYELQARWSGVAMGPVDASQRERADAIVAAAPLRDGPLRVLELGAGGGQAAAATAALGHHVTAVELTPTPAAHARELAARVSGDGSMTVVEGDFYTVALTGPFDVVAYWDGFGVGADADQRILLRRIAGWLAEDGCALLDVYTPWYWAAHEGSEMRFADVRRRYGFDAEGVRMLDSWWPEGREAEAVTQSLRCYGPADLRLLLKGTGLSLADIVAGGALDGEGRWHASVPLAEAMSYRAVLVR